ncbi:semaphorin-5A-like [Mya arenaria]|uniref:semaphorin-5A-like n=1 Tax=Mya arenaria TaxID=6604 RepID=UPI0022E85152|nr:semaphorin-5A-like [Mya arenaria]
MPNGPQTATDATAVDGGWADWFEWGACSTTCGSGSRTRVRICKNPKPAYGGNFCDGDFEEFSNCSINPDMLKCSTDGEWGFWGPWAKCEDNITYPYRACDNPRPYDQGKNSFGQRFQYKTCTTCCLVEKPNDTKPQTPNVIKPETPNVFKPEKPNDTKPQTPNVIKPETPNVFKPEKPNDTKPQTPNVIKPETPNVTKPQTPYVT